MTFEKRTNILHGLAVGEAIVFYRDVAQMRREYNVIAFAQRMIVCQGFLVVYIERRSGDFTICERIDQGSLVDDGPSRSIDQASGRLHQRKLARRHQPS